MEALRKIIHIDMDCYFAAVEMREHPEYVGKPIAVGGATDRRGVIATCNYEARAFGVRSAMATAQALKLCPHLILAKGNMPLYQQISKQIRAIFQQYTDLIEPLSLDEAYLDVTDCQFYQGSATLIAEAIRRDIYQQTRLTASAGVAPNKFIAKIASDENKPNGICVVPPNQVESFVKDLPLQKINGVGKAALAKLNTYGLFTAADVRKMDLSELTRRLGSFAETLHQRCHGIDTRPVITSRVRKSIGVEHTLQHDIYKLEQSLEFVDKLYASLIKRINSNDATNHIGKVGVKLKFSDFQQTSLETSQFQLDKDYFIQLLDTAWQRSQGRGIRLIGLSVGLKSHNGQQLAQQLSFQF